MKSPGPTSSAANGRRLDPKYAPVLVPAVMAVAMTFTMSLVQSIVRLGFVPALPATWLSSFAIGLVVAVPTAIVAAPRAQRLVRSLTGTPARP